MKLTGLFLLLAVAFIVSREYSGYMRKRLAECEGFLAFVKYMRRQVYCFLKSPREIGRGFHGEAIEPFLTALEREESIYNAYLSSRSSFSLSDEEQGALCELFSSIGTCYADDGIKLLDSSLERLGALHSELLSHGGRSVRIVATLSATLAVGIFILVI